MSSATAERVPDTADRFLGFLITPLTRRRLRNFRRNRRGFWSMWLFLLLFVISLFAEFLANDRPIVVQFEDELLFPVFVDYPETRFGGDFETAADYRDPYVKELIADAGGLAGEDGGGDIF